MLTPEELQDIPDSLVSLFDEFDEWVIRDYSERVAKAASIDSSAEWLLERSAEMGTVRSTLKEKTEDLLNQSIDEMEQVTEHTMDQLFGSEADRLAISRDVLSGVENDSELGQYITSVLTQTNGTFRNITGTMGFAMKSGGVRQFVGLEDAYVKACDLAQMQVASGVLDYNTACRQAIRNVAGNGVSCLDYSIGYDSGHILTVRSAVMMAVRTGVNQLCGHTEERLCQTLGLDLVEVSAHAGARPDHAAWQGGIYSLSGASRKYKSLRDATGYGTGPGLCGWNCRHTFFPYMDGAARTYSGKVLEEIKRIDSQKFDWNGKTYTYYEATQKARSYERSIIISKRQLIGFDATNDQEAFTAASVKLRQKKDVYKDFCRHTGQMERWERTQQNSYGHSIASKAVWAARKAA